MKLVNNKGKTIINFNAPFWKLLKALGKVGLVVTCLTLWFMAACIASSF